MDAVRAALRSLERARRELCSSKRICASVRVCDCDKGGWVLRFLSFFATRDHSQGTIGFVLLTTKALSKNFKQNKSLSSKRILQQFPHDTRHGTVQKKNSSPRMKTCGLISDLARVAPHPPPLGQEQADESFHEGKGGLIDDIHLL